MIPHVARSSFITAVFFVLGYHRDGPLLHNLAAVQHTFRRSIALGGLLLALDHDLPFKRPFSRHAAFPLFGRDKSSD